MEINAKTSLHPNAASDSDVTHILREIDALETRLYSRFTEIERQLEDYEKVYLQVVRKTIEDIRVENEESMEAIQLDLEVLRQKVRTKSLDLEAAQITEQGLTDMTISCQVTLTAEELERYVRQHIVRNVVLPSTSLHLDDSEDERVLFALSAKGDTGIPFAEVIQRAYDERKKTEEDMEMSAEDIAVEETVSEKKNAMGSAGRLLAATMSVVAVGVMTRYVVSRLVHS